MADNNCEGHAKISVNNNVATIDIWCTGTCATGKCSAVWANTDDIGDLHLTNSYASDDDSSGVRHQIRQYEIRDTVTNIKIPFTCDCGDNAKKFNIPVEKLEHQTTIGDVVIKVIEIIFTLGIPLIIKVALNKKPTAKEMAQTLETMGTEIGKTIEKPN